MGKNSDYYFEILAGASKANVVIAGVNWRLAGPEIEYVINNAQAEILFVGAEFYEVIEQLLPSLSSVRQVIAVDGNHTDWEEYTSWRNGE